MVVTKKIRVQTVGDGQVIDITPQVARAVAEEKVKAGTVTVFVSGSTAGVTTIEHEPGLIGDIQSLLERLIPSRAEYQHNQRWGDYNGHAHLRASLLGPSLVVPFAQSALLLGTWQQIVLMDFDNRPRTREIVLQIMGE